MTDDERKFEDGCFADYCLAVAKTLSGMLQRAEESSGPGWPEQPPGLPDVPRGELLAGGVLMLFCGMLAEESGDGGRLLNAATRLRRVHDTLPMGEDIREYAERVFNTLGVKRTKHLWN